MGSASEYLLTLTELCRMTAGDLVRAYVAGGLARDVLWVAADGAEEYRDAVADGDIAPPVIHAARSSVCAIDCPHAQRTPGRPDAEGRPIEKVWCGKPFVGPEPLCGCLVALTVGGAVAPGAKTAVASACCPDDPPRWGPTDRMPR